MSLQSERGEEATCKLAAGKEVVIETYCPAVLDSLGLEYEFFFFSSRRRHTRSDPDWSSDVCSSDLEPRLDDLEPAAARVRPRVEKRGDPPEAVRRRPDRDRDEWHGGGEDQPEVDETPAGQEQQQIGRASCRERV